MTEDTATQKAREIAAEHQEDWADDIAIQVVGSVAVYAPIQEWVAIHNIVSGHLREAVAAETERCARVAETLLWKQYEWGNVNAQIAAAIRANTARSSSGE